MKKFSIFLLLLMFAVAALQVIFNKSAEEFVEGDLYDEIMRRGKLVVGIHADSKPFSFINSKGERVGYDIELARYIAQYLVKSPELVEFVELEPSERLIKASTGEVDIVLATLTITPQRQDVVSFSIPYDVAGQAVMVKSNSSIKSLSDLAGQNVGVIFGTTAEKNMANLVPTANLRGYKNYNDAYRALKAGYINAITSDDTILSGFAYDDDGVKILPKRYSYEPYGIAFKKGDSTIKLKEKLDFAITDLKQKNVIPRLRKHWEIGF